MISFFKKGIVPTIIFLSVFLFGGEIKDAKAACEIVNAGTNFRPAGTFENYIETSAPWVYFDIKTQGCITVPSTKLDIKFYDINTIDLLNPRFVQNVSVEIGQANALLLQQGQVDFQTSLSDFTIPILLGEEGGENDCNWDDSSDFAIFSAWPQGALFMSLFENIPDCMIFAKIVDTNISQVIHDEGTLVSPRWTYECDGICDVNWVVGGPSCPLGVTPLSYGPPNICENDNNLISDFTPINQNGNGQSGGEYSIEALAPLPGFSDNPDLGGFLKSLFTILIVIAGILALIMIVVGGITYMTFDAFGKKSQGKSYILNALMGLVLALGAWIILNTINPDLASDISIGIPTVSLDAVREEWQNGNAPIGAVIANDILLGGQPITQGMAWPSDAPQRQQLTSNGITINTTNDCSPTAGGSGCTSVYFEGAAASVIQQLIDFKVACNCEVKITGGSEAWLHQTHGPNVKVIDMSATPSLNTYLNTQSGSAGNNFPTGKKIDIPGFGRFWAEGSGGSANNTAPHWHVTFN